MNKVTLGCRLCKTHCAGVGVITHAFSCTCLPSKLRGGEGGGPRAVEININGDLGEGNLGESFCRLRLRFTLAVGYFLV